MPSSERPATDPRSYDKKLDTVLSIESLLIEEYKYASTTAYQSLEDRARVINIYYIFLGILATGLATIYQFSGPTRTYSQSLVILILFVAGGLSFTFFINVIRLRQAFRESIVSMNVIKEFYIHQFQQQMPQIEQAFRWRLKTIPSGERIGSVTFWMSFLIALTGSLCLAAATALTVRQLQHDKNLINTFSVIISLIVFLSVLFLYFLYYRHSLSKHSEEAKQLKRVKEVLKEMI